MPPVAAPETVRPRRPLVRRVVAAAVALGVGPWGCGGEPSSDAEPATRRAAPAAAEHPPSDVTAAQPAARRRSPARSRTAPRARRLTEYRRWIVWRFRVRGTARSGAREDPLDQLRRALAEQYGPRPPDRRFEVRV